MTSTSQINDFIEYMTKTKKASINTLSAYERDLGSFEGYVSEISSDFFKIFNHKQ